MDASVVDTAGTLVALALTLFVFSYLIGDNVLYRLAEHIFVGVAVGYTVVLVFHTVLASKLLFPMVESIEQQNWTQFSLLLVSLGFGLLLLTKPSRTLSWLGNLSLAVLLGVGAALAIGGALLGTLLPQVSATGDITRYGPGLGVFSGLVILAGTTGVLLHFYFGASREGRLAGLRERLVQVWGGLGRWFIVIAFGALLATTFVSRLSLLVGRVQFVLDSVRGLFGG